MTCEKVQEAMTCFLYQNPVGFCDLGWPVSTICWPFCSLKWRRTLLFGQHIVRTEEISLSPKNKVVKATAVYSWELETALWQMLFVCLINFYVCIDCEYTQVTRCEAVSQGQEPWSLFKSLRQLHLVISPWFFFLSVSLDALLIYAVLPVLGIQTVTLGFFFMVSSVFQLCFQALLLQYSHINY